MNPKNARILLTKFPFVYPHMSRQRDHTGFYFECGDGWYKLVFRLCNIIQRELERSTAEVQENFRVVQMKEKFGGLCFYVQDATDNIHKAITKAEAESFDTCENCGKRGNQDGSGYWIKTLCGRCRKNFDRKEAREAKKRKVCEKVIVKTFDS